MKVKGKESKKFMRKEGNELKKETKKEYRSMGIGSEQIIGKQIEKGFTCGKPYKYQGRDLSIRVYNKHPLAHLLDKGHRIVDAKGQENGFVAGYHFFDKSEAKYKNKFILNTKEWLDYMIEESGL